MLVLQNYQRNILTVKEVCFQNSILFNIFESFNKKSSHNNYYIQHNKIKYNIIWIVTIINGCCYNCYTYDVKETKFNV